MGGRIKETGNILFPYSPRYGPGSGIRFWLGVSGSRGWITPSFRYLAVIHSIKRHWLDYARFLHLFFIDTVITWYQGWVVDRVNALQAACVDRKTTKPHQIGGKGESQHLFDAQKWTYEMTVPFFCKNNYIKFSPIVIKGTKKSSQLPYWMTYQLWQGVTPIKHRQ